MNDGIDLSAAERLLDLPISIPIRPVADIAPGVFAQFSSSLFCIEYDLAKMLFCEEDPNAILLHELIHVRQWLDHPATWADQCQRDLAAHGYQHAPHEIDANCRARDLCDAGVRVYFPARGLPDLSQFEDLEDARAAFEAWSGQSQS